MFGFAFFNKEKKSPVKTRKRVSSVSTEGSSGDSGVEKYLKQKNTAENKITRVSQYIQEKEDLNVEKEESLTLSGVAKYLETREEDSPVSSVSKYVARKTLHEKKIAKENVSGVEKYLNNHN